MTSPLPADHSRPPIRARSLVAGLLTAPLAALQFLTVAPPLVRRPFTPDELGAAVGFFPLVGLLIGELLAVLNGALTHLFPQGVSAALLLCAWIGASGALHLDRFLDACDGLFGGHTTEERLRIMRDSRTGAFGVAGGALLLLTAWAALANLSARTGALILAAVLARWAMALAVAAYPYARATGLGRAMKDAVGWPQALLATAITLATCWLVADLRGLLAWAITGLAGWLILRWVLRRLPGLTGDVYGALCQVLEALVLLLFVAFEQRGL